jgi:hypothetical protein
MTIVLFTGLAVCAAVAWRRRAWVTAAGWAGLLGVVCVSWVMPWYVLWALPFAALGSSRSLRRAALWVSGFLLVTLAPITGYVLDKTHLDPANTATGKHNDAAIHRYLR